MAIDTNLNKLVINKLTKAQYQEAKQSNSIVETEIYMITDKEDIDADTLGGRAASEFATQSFVTNKIAEASLSGSDVDLSGYVSKDGSTTMTGNLQMGGKKVVNLGTPTADTDAVTKGYVDDRIDIARITATSENLNNYTSQGTYYFVDGSTPVNAPENNNNGYLVVLPSLNYIKQIWLRAGSIDLTSSQTFVRTAQRNNEVFEWSAWEKFVTDADVIPISQGGTGATDAATARTKLGAATVLAGESIPSGADLNTYTTSGTYRSPSGTISASLVNTPYTVTGFKLEVFNTTSSDQLMQEIKCNAGSARTYRRIGNKAGGVVEFGDWYKVMQSAGDVLGIADGGTGANSAEEARTKLGITPENIGAAPTSHNQSAATITSGTLGSARLPTVPITKGGTGATDAITAAANLGIVSGKNLTDTDYEIPSGADLNTYTTVGAYRVGSSSVTQSLTNAPPVTNAGFRLHVIHTTTAAGVIQMAIYNATAPTIYVRVCGSSGTWGDWAKVLTSILRSGYDYGDTLPAAGTAGRIFFKKA